MFHFPQSHIQIILQVHSECFFFCFVFPPHHRIQYCSQLLFQGVLCPGPAQVPELWVSCVSSSTTNLNPSLNHWCLMMRKRRRKMMSQSWSCCHWGVRAGCESLQCWVSPLHREGNKSEYTVKYFIKDKQELWNCLLLNINTKSVWEKLWTSPLGLVGFLTELSCPLTSWSLLSSSLLFSRVSSSLDFPMLLLAAVHEKTTEVVTVLGSTFNATTCPLVSRFSWCFCQLRKNNSLAVHYTQF